MEVQELQGMDRLLPTVEQAKLLGIIKEPEELTLESKNHFTVKGLVLGSLITLSLVLVILGYYEHKKRKDQESSHS